MRLLDDYAQLLVSALQLQEGQCLFVRSESVHWPLITAIADAAYRSGVRYVDVHATHHGLRQAQVRQAREEYLDYFPAAREAQFGKLINERWGYMALIGPADPHAFRTLDAQRFSRTQQAWDRALWPLRQEIMVNHLNWLVCAAPTAGWAAELLARPADVETCEALWELMIPILRLDMPDPSDFWWKHVRQLQAQARALTERGIIALHFQGPGTDLRIGISPAANWKGGLAHNPSTGDFICNLPTEEVFTTPDYRRTEGVVRLSRPTDIAGILVEDVTLHFRAGRLEEWQVGRGREAFEQMLATDEGIRYLGEVALVDCQSPIFRSGRIFNNTLFDENAACHIALGSAYPSRIAGGEHMSPAEMSAAGINQSILHHDVMIGSEAITVTAEARNGERFDLIRDGYWV